jgi:serine/threonine protein phosphatase PrpC
MYRGIPERDERNEPVFVNRHVSVPTAMNVEFAQLSDLGRVREQNEDYLGCVLADTPRQARTRGWLFVLADGVGGQAQGEVASRMAVEAMIAGFRQAADGEPLGSLLKRLAQEANTRVLQAAHQAGPSGAGMATTVVACALRFDRAVVAHAGDSRCYLIRRGQAHTLTRDHTIAGEQARLGLIAAGEEAEESMRHMLSRALGTELTVAADVSEHPVLAGDVLLLCSDGLHGEVSGAEMAAAVRENGDLRAAARHLVSLANARGGGDNISVQLIRVLSVERVGTYRGLPYKLR